MFARAAALVEELDIDLWHGYRDIHSLYEQYRALLTQAGRVCVERFVCKLSPSSRCGRLSGMSENNTASKIARAQTVIQLIYT